MKTRPFAAALVVTLSAVACGGSAPPATTTLTATRAAPSAALTASTPPIATGGSVDHAAIDHAVRPGSDFFMYANGAWYAKATIDPDRSRAGAWVVLAKEIEGRTRAILEDAAKSAPKGSQLQKVGDYYATVLDEGAIEKKGLAPLKPTLDRIAKVSDLRALSTLLGSQLRADVDPLNATNLYTDHLFGLFVEQNLDDPTHASPYLLQGGLGMPDRSYYVDATPAMTEMRAKYVKHLAAMFRLAGASAKDADGKAARVMALETKMATAHASRTESEEVSTANNPWPRDEFAKRAPGIDWTLYFEAAQLSPQKTIVVWHPKAVTGLSALVKSEPIATWREYLTARALEHAAWFLPKAFVDEHANFALKDLLGVPELPPRSRRAFDATNDAMGEAVGQAYVAKWFPPQSKKQVEAMVADLVAAFGKRIDALAWMSPATRAKAKEKLATLKVSVGYPDKWRDDTALTIVRGDAVGNLERAELFTYQQALAKIGKPVDRAEWVMVPQVVNAVNLPVRNALNFPAGILSPPFFDPKATAATNYGAIGVIIGHEISHSFDDQGAKFDAQGRFADWWTKEDLAHFEASGAALAAQFSAYKPFPDLSVNGKQTLSENIADLAGLAAAWDAWRASLDGKPAPTEGGLTGEQQFFISNAQSWQTKERPESLRARLATDGHAPARYRVLTVRNLDPWYTAFDVKPEDALYLAPDKLVRVW